MNNADLCQGLILGFLIAGILGFLLQQLAFHRLHMNAPRRQVRTFPPEETPLAIIRRARQAGCTYYALLALFVFAVIMAVLLIINLLS